MISLGTQSIREMNTALAEKRESMPKSTTKQKRSRARRARRLKSKATVDSDSSDSTDEQATKSEGSR